MKTEVKIEPLTVKKKIRAILRIMNNRTIARAWKDIHEWE